MTHNNGEIVDLRAVDFYLLCHLLSRHDFAHIGSKHPVLIVKSK